GARAAGGEGLPGAGGGAAGGAAAGEAGHLAGVAGGPGALHAGADAGGERDQARGGQAPGGRRGLGARERARGVPAPHRGEPAGRWRRAARRSRGQRDRPGQRARAPPAAVRRPRHALPGPDGGGPRHRPGADPAAGVRALIVDDERLARSELRRLLRDFPDVEVVGEAGHVAEAEERVKALSPELIFLDIEMPGGSGFDLLQRLEDIPAVIFTTAYDAYAVRAFEVNALDYLLKPIEPA